MKILMEESLEQLKNALSDDNVVHIKDAILKEGKYTTPYPIGYDIIDDAMKGGVREGNLIIMTGLSGDGKSTTLQGISVNLSNNGNNCLWFSYEMLIDDFYARFKEMGCNCENLKLYIPKQMTSGNLGWVQKKIKEGLEKFNTKFIFIEDTDDLIPMEKIRNSDQERIRLKNVCVELKHLAKRLEIIIFLVHHLKKVYGRAAEMQDLKESASVFQKADFVLTVERYVEIVSIGGRKTEVMTGESAIRILKNRITGQKVKMNFHLENNRIVPEGVVKTSEEVLEEKSKIMVEEKIENKNIMFGDKS